MNKFYALIALVFALSGCAGSSMEVAVDVYQGPLSKSKEVQWQEVQVLARLVCVEDLRVVVNQNDKKEIISVEEHRDGDQRSSYEVIDSSPKFQLEKPTLRGSVSHDEQVKKLESYAYCASRVLQNAYSEALWKDIKEIDGIGIERTVILARNLLSRSELLLQQLKGENRHLLPLSAYLAEASPSLFIEYCYNTSDALPTTIKNEPCNFKRADRFAEPNLADALLSEQYWQRINHVHSSGMGDVATAFVKDDIGNWSLKSFDSNPEELLKAYQDLSLKALSSAAKIASGTATPVSINSLESSKRLTAFAESIAFGDSASTSNDIAEKQVTTLRQETILALKDIKQSYSDKKAQIEEAKPQEDEAVLTGKLEVQKENAKKAKLALCNVLKSSSEGVRDGSGLCTPSQSGDTSKLSAMKTYWQNQLESDPLLFSQNKGSRLAKWSELMNTIDLAVASETQLLAQKQKQKDYETSLSQLEKEFDQEVQVELDRYALRLSNLQDLSLDTRALTPPAN
ncbi:hypothetical protein INR79_26040 [Vibrio sp. SCSIO 43132]|uniref:hypothetical protein n=1 Tax=Vibrio sp. SCSIO 43132 TaxID=2779363 RepID=UPI001CA8F99A|nr:hypothetical protein [Vibrio sp. SCSIO 43132]UAB72716.1 hypothetical protein INR79_26040 [Vibrio sp. SCSIO 43132]